LSLDAQTGIAQLNSIRTWLGPDMRPAANGLYRNCGAGQSQYAIPCRLAVEEFNDVTVAVVGNRHNAAPRIGQTAASRWLDFPAPPIHTHGGAVRLRLA
jgi:hypothetical protein